MQRATYDLSSNLMNKYPLNQISRTTTPNVKAIITNVTNQEIDNKMADL